MFVINPKTGRKIKVDGYTYNTLLNDPKYANQLKKSKRVSFEASPKRRSVSRSSSRSGCSSCGRSRSRSSSRSSSRSRSSSSKSSSRGCSNAGKYKGLRASDFCGPAGGACPGTYPVNTRARARAALSYARHAPSPKGIRDFVMRKAKARGWLDENGRIKQK